MKPDATVKKDVPNVQVDNNKLLNLGITPDQLNKINSPEGMDPTSFQGLVGQVENKLKTNNDLVTTRGYLIKHLYDSPLTPDELSKLPPDVQQVVSGGNKDRIELQMRLINDQIAGRAKTLDSSIGYLTDGYKNAIQQQKDAYATVLNYAKALNAKPSDVLKALYPNLIGNVDSTQLTALDKLGAPLLTTTQIPNIISGGYSVDPISAATEAIVGNESGGNYQAKSPILPSGAHAGERSYGKYQVLESNVGPWTEQYYGQSLTPQEFLDNSEAQDAVAKGRIGELWNKYGNIQDVASIWFTGSPASESKGKVDQATGMTSEKYIQKAAEAFNKSISSSSVNQFTNDASYPADNIKNVSDPQTGLTPLTIYNDAVDFAFTTKGIQSYIGGLSSGPKQMMIKEAIQNKSSAILDSLGLRKPEAAAIYAANKSAVKQNTERFARVDSITNSVINQIPRLAALADQIKSQNIDITESDLQATGAEISRKFGNTPAAQYLELVQTIRADYAANNAALAGSRGGEFFARTANEAIPIGLSGDQYNAIKDTMVQSSKNIKDGIHETLQNLLSEVSGKGDSNSFNDNVDSSSVFDNLYSKYGGK